MKIHKLIALALASGLFLTVVTPAAPAAASVLAGPCAPGSTYDPACDVDHDGDVDIFDIQLTASRWNRTGTWVSDNDHNHLGQTWTGNNNPLVIQGAFGLPGVAPLVLTNSGAGDGLWITDAGKSGVFIGPTGNDGVFVNQAGSPRTTNTSSLINGLEVAGAQDVGVFVGYAGSDGVRVSSADQEGVLVGDAARSGVRVNSAGFDGVRVLSADAHGLNVFAAGNDGLRVQTAGQAGVYVGDVGAQGLWIDDAAASGIVVNNAGNSGVVINNAGGHGLYIDNTAASGIYVESRTDKVWGIVVAGALGNSAHFDGWIWVGNGCYGNCRLAMFAVNSGNHTLSAGAIVAIRGTVDTDMLGDTTRLYEVSLAEPGDPVIGVVSSRAALEAAHEYSDSSAVLMLEQGDVGPGDYLAIVYNGPVQVKTSVPVEVGQKLTVADDGSLRPLRTARVDGMEIAEHAPVLGIALESTKPGQDTIWVLVNPQ